MGTTFAEGEGEYIALLFLAHPQTKTRREGPNDGRVRAFQVRSRPGRRGKLRQEMRCLRELEIFPKERAKAAKENGTMVFLSRSLFSRCFQNVRNGSAFPSSYATPDRARKPPRAAQHAHECLCNSIECVSPSPVARSLACKLT